MLTKFLLDTNDTVLAEANSRDSLFGIGFGLDNPNVWDQATWKGTNLQGKMLQKISTFLRR